MALSREECESAVRQALSGIDCTLLDYRVQPASDSPIGYMGTHIRVEATVSLGGAEKKVLKLFAKRPPMTASHRSYVATCNFFYKERMFYTSYAPRMQSVLPPGVKLPLAECYLARGTGDGDTDLVVMEDLTVKGFRMLDKRSLMDLNHCRVVLDALARLHGASVLLMRTEGSPNALYRKGEFELIEENVFMYDLTHPSCQWCKASAETVASTVSLLWPERYGSESSRREVFEHTWAAWKDVFRYVRYSQTYSNVLCHGDTWPNNMMLSYRKTEDGKEVPSEAILIDYQLHRYCPPILDILFFLQTTTRRAFREEHFEDLVRHYWEAFRRVVSPEIADSFLPLEQLMASAEEMRAFGRVFGTTLLSLVLVTDDEKEERTERGDEEEHDFIKEVLRDRSEDVLRNVRKDPCIGERLMEVYEEFLESVGMWDKK